MQLDIISPDKQIFSGEATYVSVPGKDGSLGILNNHAPMISALVKGGILVRQEGGVEQTIEVKGGVIEVLKNKVIILAE
ncbi:MAG: ATP synthase F1 subunit epsilon [Bacteroidetes bacterium]|jgi:F-type H+-transporting ATPase subunit epsilon|nr:ATP synthase F1 subunit epsilon [Bacteroidota bacterium]